MQSSVSVSILPPCLGKGWLQSYLYSIPDLRIPYFGDRSLTLRFLIVFNKRIHSGIQPITLLETEGFLKYVFF